MKKRLPLGALLLALSLIATGVQLLHPVTANGQNVNASGTEVRVDNFTFGPEAITVSVNSTVTWVNKDDVPHVIASTEGVFKSKALDTDDKYSYTFSKPGTYPYFCAIHPKMVGKVIVQ